MNIPDIWNCNIHYKDISKIQCKSEIWHSIWKAWAIVSYKSLDEIDTVGEIMNQVIWFNSHMKLHNNFHFYPMMYKKGIIKIIHLMDNTQTRLLTFQEATIKYGNIGNFLQYMAVLRMIPQFWKCKMSSGNIAIVAPESLVKSLSEKDKISNRIYSMLLIDRSRPDGARLIWNERLQTDLTIEEWETIRTNSYYVSLSTKLRYFQVRLLSNKITTRDRRVKWTQGLDTTCQLCKRNHETIMHIMWYRSEIKRFWEIFKRWCNYIFDIQVLLSHPATIIYNNYKGPHRRMINTMILIAKQYIYACTCLEEKVKFNKFYQEIIRVYYVELQIAHDNGYTRKHALKWQQLNRAIKC